MNTWNELTQSEEPALELLQSLGYEFVPAAALEDERAGPTEAILSERLLEAVRKLNPWITDANAKRAVRSLTGIQAASLMEANEMAYVALVHTTTVQQDIGDGQGKKHRSVRLIDFDVPGNNDLVVTRQFRVRGAKHDIVPDIVVFVNGIPLAVIECKSPTMTGDALATGIGDMLQYQELDDRHRGLGAPRLFEAAQLLLVVCGQQARYATVGTPMDRWAEWKQPYPLTLDKLQQQIGRIPTPQDVLLYGLLFPQNLLDLTQNFVVFEKQHGRTTRKTARYQQFAAVNKAIQRIRGGKKRDDRGGVVWHTQGSGKSLTMLWLAVRLRRLSELQNPTLLIVTDRTDLDDQIIGTFRRCGFSDPVQAKGVNHLRSLFDGTPGRTIMTTVQKFTAEDPKNPPLLTDDENVFVLVDEAHRSHYKLFAANMRAGLRHACFIAFTGTPIEKKNRGTLRTFGTYIDTYTIEQSVADNATVPIYYEARHANLSAGDETLDQLFDRIFADHSSEDREALKRRYATKRTLGSIPERIKRIAFNILDHYERYIRPDGFKAQVVADSQGDAVAYLKALRSYEPQGYEVEVVISADQAEYEEYKRTQREERAVIERFKDPEDPLSILVVCDKLLTGFDAPVEQVMYLDASLREHRLLQAIARVNRPAPKKDYGLVVDYRDVSSELQDALNMFVPEEQSNVMTPLREELPRLQARQRQAMRFFDRVNPADLEACVRVLEPEDTRAAFDLAFRRFSQSLEILLPNPAGLAYVGDLAWLGQIRNAARLRYRDPRLDLAASGDKVRRLIEEHVRATGIENLLEPVSIFSERFEEELAKLSSPEAKASEMEHAIRHEITVHLEENPVFYRSLRQRLEEVIEDWRQERIDAADQLRLLQSISGEIKSVSQQAQERGMNDDEYAFYGMLSEGASLSGEDGDTNVEDLAREVVGALSELAVVDWARKDDVQREMRRRLKRLLRSAGAEASSLDSTVARLMDIARARLS